LTKIITGKWTDWMIKIERSSGTTPTENRLSELCDGTFLKLWTYPNPFKSDGDEICDLIVIFENDVFLFFDRHNKALEKNTADDLRVAWKRWEKATIERQIRSVKGAEKYIRNPENKIYLDSRQEQLLPVEFDRTAARIHKVIVANGAEEACKSFSPDNVSGSLAISYTKDVVGLPPIENPFLVRLKSEDEIHVFGQRTLEIILQELDTISDFTNYINAKLYAIRQVNFMFYCAEEDILARYLKSWDEDTKSHFLYPQNGSFDSIAFAEGEWEDLITYPQFIAAKKLNEPSYLWDDLIQRTSESALMGELGGDGDVFNRPSAIREMAKEPRFYRRALSQQIMKKVSHFPETTEMYRDIGFYPSFREGVSYLFMIINIPGNDNEKIRKMKRELLRIACGAACNKYQPRVIVGLAIENPKAGLVSEDFMYMDCNAASEEYLSEIEKLNTVTQFFETDELTRSEVKTSAFPDST